MKRNSRVNSHCTPIDSKKTDICLLDIQLSIILKRNFQPSEQLPFDPRSKSIFFSRFLFCCDISLIFLSISFCLLITVSRSLQQSHSSTVVFCDKAVPQTSLLHRDRKNKGNKIPLKIWPAILRVTRCNYALQ